MTTGRTVGWTKSRRPAGFPGASFGVAVLVALLLHEGVGRAAGPRAAATIPRRPSSREFLEKIRDSRSLISRDARIKVTAVLKDLDETHVACALAAGVSLEATEEADAPGAKGGDTDTRGKENRTRDGQAGPDAETEGADAPGAKSGDTDTRGRESRTRDGQAEPDVETEEAFLARAAADLPRGTPPCERWLVSCLRMQLDLLDRTLSVRDAELSRRLRKARTKRRLRTASERVFRDGRDVVVCVVLTALEDMKIVHEALGVEGEISLRFPSHCRTMREVEAYLIRKVALTAARARRLREGKERDGGKVQH